MENFSVTIRYFRAVPGRGITVADMKAEIRGAWTEVGEDWHSRLRPKHFTAAGGREYGYLPRKGDPGNPGRKGFFSTYMGRKTRSKHHRRPLVWSGELEDATRGRRIETRAFTTRSRLRVVMPQARKANWRNPHSRIDMGAELTTISAAEVPELVGIHNRSMQARLRRFGGGRTKTI